jgi:hypothetical protein
MRILNRYCHSENALYDLRDMIDRASTKFANASGKNGAALIGEAERLLTDVCGTSHPSLEVVRQSRLSKMQNRSARKLAFALGELGRRKVQNNDSEAMWLLTDLRERLLLLIDGKGYWSENKVIATMEEEIACSSIVLKSIGLLQCRIWRIFNHIENLDKVSTGVHLDVQLLNGHAPIQRRIKQGWIGDPRAFRAYYERSDYIEPPMVEPHVKARVWDQLVMHNIGKKVFPKRRKTIRLSLTGQARKKEPRVWGFDSRESLTEEAIQKKKNSIQRVVLEFLTSRRGFSKCLLEDL